MDNNRFPPACGNAKDKINWVCKICKDLPDYAGMYLWQREHEKNKTQGENEQRADLLHMKYYYALLHLLDKIHKFPGCPDPECLKSEYTGQQCPSPEHFDHYRKMYNTYAVILMEKGLEEINIKCDICAVLPYTLSSDLELVAKNMHSADMEEAQKLELDEIVADYYLRTFGLCERWETCPNSVNWLELMHSTQVLKEYLKTKDCKELHINLSFWNRARATDNILSTGLKVTSKDFQVQDILLYELEGKTVVYLDFGVYQVYENNEVFRTQLDTYVGMNKIQFVYGPTHMEEVCRMSNSVYENKRRESISKICNDHEVLSVQNGFLKIVIEPVDICFARAKKLQDLNKCAEESECARFETLEEQTCKMVGWDKRERDKHKKAISALTLIELFDPQNETIDNKTLNQIFCGICGSSVPLEELKDYDKEERTFPEIREAVRLLYMLMNALGYHKNKIEKRTQFTYEALYPTYDRKFYRTIRSGFYDVDHLCYASKCDYFVTCDYVLSLQAKEIYRYLGCKTHVIYCEKKTSDPFLPLAALCGEADTM